MPTAISLFSGIGGLDEGLRRTGWQHALMCESDPYRRDVLRARFPGVPVYDDVRAVATADFRLAGGRRERQELGREGSVVDSRPAGEDEGAVVVQDAGGVDPPVDLVCGGFPCQDLSVAGKRAGLNGSRSGLFFEFARIIDAVRPRWLLVENVPGLLSSDGGRDFGVVLGTLADIGYGLGWRILDSRFFGVPQRRRRVFILGARADGDPRAAAERAGQVLAVGSRCRRHPATRGEAREDVAVASLSGLGSGGPDDNDGQANRVIVADTVRSHPRPGSNSNGNLAMVAAPLSHGSNPNSNMAGRRREDDVNLVAIPISGDALRGEGSALTPSPDAEGRVRLRDPGMAVGEDGDPAFTMAASGPGAVAFHMTQDPISGDRQGTATIAVNEGASVRRLTPTECERLQALPDGWTDLGGTPDSRRYAALGDAVTASVAEWIGRRIIEAS